MLRQRPAGMESQNTGIGLFAGIEFGQHPAHMAGAAVDSKDHQAPPWASSP
ncbi:hypothetical protein DSECCO2_384560 [anaerobic digester metagenome]